MCMQEGRRGCRERWGGGHGGGEGRGGRSLGILFPGGRKEVVSIKNTNNEIALTVIPFSLTRICWEKNKINPAVFMKQETGYKISH